MSQFKTEPGCMLFVQNLMNLLVDEDYATEEPSDQSQITGSAIAVFSTDATVASKTNSARPSHFFTTGLTQNLEAKLILKKMMRQY